MEKKYKFSISYVLPGIRVVLIIRSYIASMSAAGFGPAPEERR
jgi:hypothetical protein